MQVFDVALIGAGPAGYAALTAMRGFSGSVVVVTGAASEPSKGGPAKIVSVAYERQQPACLAERTDVSGDAPPMFVAAEIGGLANYWGKQLQVYDSDDPWGQGDFLRSWAEYKGACDAVQGDLHVIGGVRKEQLDDGLEQSAPRLLVGTKDEPDSGLRAMAQAIENRLSEIAQIEVRAGRVQRIENDKQSVSLSLDDGTQIRARRVFLAAGVLGTATLLARSLPQVAEIGFLDHAPYTINCLGLGRALGSPRDYMNRGNFNALTLKQRHEGRCDMFASVYAVSQAPVSLVTTTLGLGPRLRGWRMGRFIDFVQPVRIWTRKTYVQFRYRPDQGPIEATNISDPDQDEALQGLLRWLASHRVRHNLGITAPGQGFHYHNLTLGAGKEPVDQAVETAFQGRVRVVDASCLSEIGCQPHTLTSMAQAYGRVRRDMALAERVREAI
ncbi:FAD/NAD(P)-binding protein [Ruegeria arenilitoris]|uniref:FAD/NAD(P)-binding protein n=1 Tax=Ruegeria arenilitoris TaxID=1173585 RepID=UPI0014807342|nr:FAD/NAD(P)-binding protein [Ruegeria arenilitoris]